MKTPAFAKRIAMRQIFSDYGLRLLTLEQLYDKLEDSQKDDCALGLIFNYHQITVFSPYEDLEIAEQVEELLVVAWRIRTEYYKDQNEKEIDWNLAALLIEINDRNNLANNLTGTSNWADSLSSEAINYIKSIESDVKSSILDIVVTEDEVKAGCLAACFYYSKSSFVDVRNILEGFVKSRIVHSINKFN